MQRLILFIAAFYLAGVFPAVAEDVTFQSSVSLQGRVLGDYVMADGGFISADILYLNQPVTIQGNKKADRRQDRKKVKNVARILLIPAQGVTIKDDMKGNSATVTGILSHEPSDIHHTEVRMLVSSISSIDVPSEPGLNN